MTDLELYNKLTGKSVKRFSSKADGEKRLSKAIRLTKQMKVFANGCYYFNVEDAFIVIGFDLTKEEKFRFKLYLSKTGKATFAGMSFKRC